jgi:hypothetical protein
LFVGVDVELTEEGGQRAFAGGVEAGEAQGEPEGPPVVAGELGDGFQAAQAGEQGHGGEAEDRPEGMPPAAPLAWVGDGGEDFLQGGGGGSWHKKTPMTWERRATRRTPLHTQSADFYARRLLNGPESYGKLP